MSDLPPAVASWLAEVTGGVPLTVERRIGGASRAGFAVDARHPDGTVDELWLRLETGVGPQAATAYTLAREAAVYRALQGQGVRVARLVATHPDGSAFLLSRVPGRSRSSRM